jgi:hypothetical protein
MTKKILTQVFFWAIIITADALCYLKTWNNTVTLATIVKYGVLISSFYLCYSIAYFRLKKTSGTVGLGIRYKIGLLLAVCTFSISTHYFLDLYLNRTNYGLSIYVYYLNRLWIIGPVLYSIITLLEKQNGQFKLTLIKTEYHATKMENERLLAQSGRLKSEVERLMNVSEAEIEKNRQLLAQNELLQKEIMINQVEKIMSEEHLNALRQDYARRLKDIEDLLNRQNDDEPFD